MYYFLTQNLIDTHNIIEVVGHTDETGKHIWIEGNRFPEGVSFQTLILAPTYGTGMADFFEDLGVQAAYGVPRCLVGLCKLSGIGKTHARALYNMGVRTPFDLPGALSLIDEAEQPELLDAVRKVLDDVPGESGAGVREDNVRGVS